MVRSPQTRTIKGYYYGMSFYGGVDAGTKEKE